MVQRFFRSKKALIGSVMLFILIIVGVVGPVTSPYDYDQMRAGELFELPNPNHPLGADEYGRDILVRILSGVRLSLATAATVALSALLIGAFLGIISGYYKGFIDDLLSAAADILFSLPTVLWALMAVLILGPGLPTAVAALSFTYIPQFLRIARSSALSMSAREFVDAARAVGAGNGRILVRHVLPNCAAPLMVQFALSMSLAILDESVLSFVGLGAQPPSPSWGLMIRTGIEYLNRAQHLTIVPGVAIVYLVLAFNLLSDGLQDVLSPYASRTRAG
jgi:peptide/nickel transport system permease protein